MKSEEDKEKFIIIDGNSLMNRAFYALPLLKTKQGFFTNAVYGFVSMLIKTIEDENPEYLAVVFDKAAPTFRHEKYPDYKGHREKTPEELKGQIPLLKELLHAMGVFFYEKEGYEADDLIGAFSEKADKKGDKEITIISGDKDLIQLLTNESTKLFLTRKGISEFELYDREKVKEVYDLEVEKFLDLKALMGDKSDNIPGVPGIGEKTATKLLKEFDNLDEIINNIDKISAKKAASRIVENHDKAILSKELARIHSQVPVEMDWDELNKFDFSSKEALTLLKEWEMKSILERISKKISREDIFDDTLKNSNDAIYPSSTKTFEANYFYITKDESEKRTKEILSLLSKSNKAAIYYYSEKDAPEQKSIDPGEFGLAVAIPDPDGEGDEKEKDFGAVNCFFIPQDNISDFIKNAIIPNFPDRLVAHRIKDLWHLFYNEAGKDLSSFGVNITDIEIGGYLLDPTGAPHTPRDLALLYLDKNIKNNNEGYEGVCEWALAQLELESVLLDKLKEEEQWLLYEEIEHPLSFVLARMEHRGITVDRNELEKMEREIDTNIEKLKYEIYQLAGEEFNLNSPKQLGKILFEKLNLPVIKKTKTGYSTSAQVLETLAKEHKICRLILDYRQIYKLKTTYLVGLKELIPSEKIGKIHTTFNQTITVTGRLSSTEPNLQNIPIRLEEGRKIRKAFVTRDTSFDFLACDYSQIELRILAHVSGDKRLIEAFEKGEDFHTQTAALIFDVSLDEVDGQMRSHAKAVNFGIVYGISDYGLSTQLDITRKQAKIYIDSYFNRFPGVKEYTDDVIKKAKEQGYVETLYHRKRKLPDIRHENFNRRTAAERTAMNTPIQGTAADIIKKAMVEVENRLAKERYLDQAKLLLQVHDELVLEVKQDVFDEVARMVKDIMEQVIELKVPLVADIKRGKNWYEMNDYKI